MTLTCFTSYSKNMFQMLRSHAVVRLCVHGVTYKGLLIFLSRWVYQISTTFFKTHEQHSLAPISRSNLQHLSHLTR